MNEQEKTIKMLNSIAQAIYDKKGMNILAIDIQDVSSLTNYFIIAEGSVDRHVKAISREVQDRMAEEGVKPFHVDGDDQAHWVVMDFGEVLIHLFTPELREKYKLEELWREGKVVDLNIEVSN